MSGYTANVIARDAALDGEGVNLIQKPFTSGDLAVMVRAALEGPGALP